MTRPTTRPEDGRPAPAAAAVRGTATRRSARRTLARPLLTLLLALPLLAVWSADAAAQAGRRPGELPANPDPNACYARVWVPGETQERPKQVVIQDEAEELFVEQAEYQWVERDVEIETASERIEVIPARFEDQTREIVIEPERREVKVLPPVFATIDQPVLIRPAFQSWRPCAAVEEVRRGTGEVMCFDTVPAEYTTIKSRVLREPARLETRVIPAKTRTIKVRVMVERPRRRIINIPAKTIKVRMLEEVRPLRTTRRPIEPRYATVNELVPVSQGRVDWVPALCESNTRPSLVRDIQRALRRRGFDPGPIDGVLGSRTMSALQQFQRSNGLPEGGLLIESLQALGVDTTG